MCSVTGKYSVKQSSCHLIQTQAFIIRTYFCAIALILLTARLLCIVKYVDVDIQSSSLLCSMMSVIDMSGNLSLYGIESDSSKANQVDFHRKDVWDVRWAWVSRICERITKT